MEFAEIRKQLEEKCGDLITGANAEAIDPWIEVSPEGFREVASALRDEIGLQFNMLHCITGVDYFEPDEKKAAKVEWEPHLEVIYHLSSIVHKHRIVIKVMLPRWKDDEEGALPEVASVCDLWSTADWHEREVYDLMGVRFTGRDDLRRILCPEDWEGHPLRKDYKLPVEYHGIRTE